MQQPLFNVYINKPLQENKIAIVKNKNVVYNDNTTKLVIIVLFALKIFSNWQYKINNNKIKSYTRTKTHQTYLNLF